MQVCLSKSFCCASATEMNPIQIEIFESISAINQNTWHLFIPKSHLLLSYSYLQLIEQNQANRMQFVYALLRKEEELVGIIYLQIVRFKGTNLAAFYPDYKAEKNLSRKILYQLLSFTKPLLPYIEVPILVFGNLFMTGEKGVYFSSKIKETERNEFTHRAVREIFQKMPFLKIVMQSNIYENENHLAPDFIENGFQKVAVEADMEMPLSVNWLTFEDYLNALASKYRVRAKKILSTSSALLYKELNLAEIEKLNTEIFALYRNVADKVDFNLAIFTEEYFINQKKSTPSEYHIIGYFLDEKLVGFMSFFNLQNKTEVHYIGMNYEVNATFHLYQRMLYDMVKFGIENRLPSLHFGRTAPEVKSTIGAKPLGMYGFIKHKNYFINKIIQVFTKNLKPRLYVLRSPFKE